MKYIALVLMLVCTSLLAEPEKPKNNLLHLPISNTGVAQFADAPNGFKKAIDAQDVPCIKELLKKPETLAASEKADVCNGILALNYAARYGSLETLTCFLDHIPGAANIRVDCWQPWIGYPVIAFAVDSGDTAKVAELVRAGADVNSPVGISIGDWPTNDKKYAAATRNIPLLNYAISTQASLEMIRCLVDAGADVNRFSPLACYDYKIWTPLMMAADIGNYELVALLLEKGADRTIQDTCGKQAIDYAQRQGHTTICKLLSCYCPH